MLKNIVGSWGSDLNDGDYACALAALGVLSSVEKPTDLVAALEEAFASGERTAVWRTTPESIVRTASSAAVCATSWRQYQQGVQQERYAPRLALQLDPQGPFKSSELDALSHWLKHPDVGLSALVRAEVDAGAPVQWHWPLRVAVPAGTQSDGALEMLRVVQRKYSWGPRLARCFTVGDGRDACDLLILTPAAAQHVLDPPRNRIHANFVVLLDQPPPGIATSSDHHVALLHRLRAAGVAVIGSLGPSLSLTNWFEAVLRDASHDVPIHAAVWRASRLGFPEPWVIGDPQALDRCRILAVAEHLDRSAAPPSPPAVRSVDIPIASRRRGPSADATFQAPAPARMRGGLAESVRNGAFMSENVDGVRTVEEFERRESDIDRRRVPRWIQASSWRRDAPERAARSFAADQWNLLGVHIGPSAVQRPDAAFPDSLVDFTLGDVEIAVQVELAGAHVTPLDVSDRLLAGIPETVSPAELRDRQGAMARLLSGPLSTLPVPGANPGGSTIVGLASAGILLPPTGDSALALFAIRPQAGVARVEGRISIIHNNRVLQTARLSAEINAAADSGAGVVVESEASIHARDDDLNERRHYDVAMQVSDIGGKLHLTIQRNGKAEPVQLDDLEQPIAAIRKALERAAVQWDYSKPMLQQPVFTESLFTIAAHGTSLEQHLRKTCGDDIDTWERMHLVPSTNAFLPLEYVYDGLPPRIGATVCPNVLGALEAGSCDRAIASASPCPNPRDKSFVCPMHFWGFHRLIERNGTTRDAASPAAQSNPAASICVPSKQAYGKVGAILFGASNRAFAYVADPQLQAAERRQLLDAIRLLSASVADATDWDEWRAQIANKPNLLVLVPHTDQHLGTPVLEIGDHKLLGRIEILPDLSGAAGQPQLLILLGCSAAGVTENFQPYPERFRDAGVSIVLAPVAPIRGADAVPIAKRIAQLLATRLAAAEPTAFGELLPLLRRELLREGHPGVMGIVGFGDGDWLLGGP